jgi:hypothetical protein
MGRGGQGRGDPAPDRQWDPRHFAVWPIKAPTPEEKSRHFLWRFWAKLPGAGEISVFDRSWYGRVLVERVEGFASKAEWRRGYDEINEFEAQQTDDGTAIVKLFIHVSAEVQDERLRARVEHPWKRWKVTPEDFRNRAKRADYVEATGDMFRADQHPLGALARHRRQQQEVSPNRGADGDRRCARAGGADDAAACFPRSRGVGARGFRREKLKLARSFDGIVYRDDLELLLA